MKATRKSGKAAKRQRPDWSAIRVAYQRGEGSCRELAERFGVTAKALSLRCTRGKWRVAKKKTEEKVSEKLAEKLADEGAEWVRRIKASCEKDLDLIDRAAKKLGANPHPLLLRQLAGARKAVDDVMRRALGLPDAPQKAEHEGSVSIEVVDPYASDSPSKAKPSR